MAFCKNCGQQMNDDAVFCANCGTPVDNAQQAQQPQQAPVQPVVMNGDADVQQNRGLAWLAYILWTPVFLVPLFVKKRSPYCQFHVKQGATLWATHFVYWLLTTILISVQPRQHLLCRTYDHGYRQRCQGSEEGTSPYQQDSLHFQSAGQDLRFFEQISYTKIIEVSSSSPLFLSESETLSRADTRVRPYNEPKHFRKTIQLHFTLNSSLLTLKKGLLIIPEPPSSSARAVQERRRRLRDWLRAA